MKEDFTLFGYEEIVDLQPKNKARTAKVQLNGCQLRFEDYLLHCIPFEQEISNIIG